MAITIRNIPFYSVCELSQMIKVTTVTIRNYLKQGKLKGRKINGRWIISEEDANKLLRTF
jgi:predicted site-specific integrase-resolvase